MGNYRKIYEQYYGVKIPKGYHIHHKDMNHENDDPLNLEALDKDVHAQKHGFLTNLLMKSNAAKGCKHSVESRKRRSEFMKGNKRALGARYEHTEEQNKKWAELRIGKKRGPYKNKLTTTRKSDTIEH